VFLPHAAALTFRCPDRPSGAGNGPMAGFAGPGGVHKGQGDGITLGPLCPNDGPNALPPIKVPF